MGARFCLHAALSRPDRIHSLILISGTAGIEDERLRRDRVAADEALASELDPPSEAGPGPDDRERLDAFLQRWLARPLFAGIPPDVAGLAERRSNTTAGLASSLRLAGTGTQQPLWDRLPLLEMPVLIITGERDAKFTVLGRRMAETIGDNATHAVVPGVGHTAHLEDPDSVTAVIRAHLAAGGWGPAAERPDGRVGDRTAVLLRSTIPPPTGIRRPAAGAPCRPGRAAGPALPSRSRPAAWAGRPMAAWPGPAGTTGAGGHHHCAGVGQHQAADVQASAPRPTDPHGQGPLAGGRSRGMSRRLLTTSSAVASRPTGTDGRHTAAGQVAGLHVVPIPTVATTPKNTKTNASP